MAILDIFKKKNEVKIKKEAKKLPKVKVTKKAKIKEVKKESASSPDTEKKIAPISTLREKGKITGTAYKILKGVHVTEKATDLAAKNQYTFKIFSNANKTEVKRIVQEIYGIDVLDVKIITIPGKNKRMGKTLGFRPGCKKAIVRIKEGQKIEVMPK